MSRAEGAVVVLPGVHAVIQVRPASELCPVLIVANLRWSHPTFLKIKKPSAFRWGEGIDIFLDILNKHLLRFASREISSSESCSDFSNRQKKIKKDSRSQKKRDATSGSCFLSVVPEAARLPLARGDTATYAFCLQSETYGSEGAKR